MHSIFVAVGFFVVYMVYLTIGWFSMHIVPSQYPLTTFNAIFGKDFSEKNLFLYFTVCAFYKSFLFGLVYSIFSNCISLICQKAYQAILYSSLYYYGLTLLCRALPLNDEVFHAIQPAMIQGFDLFVYDPPLIWDAFSPLVTFVIPLLISTGILICFFVRGEKFEN